MHSSHRNAFKSLTPTHAHIYPTIFWQINTDRDSTTKQQKKKIGISTMECTIMELTVYNWYWCWSRIENHSNNYVGPFTAVTNTCKSICSMRPSHSHIQHSRTNTIDWSACQRQAFKTNQRARKKQRRTIDRRTSHTFNSIWESGYKWCSTHDYDTIYRCRYLWHTENRFKFNRRSGEYRAYSSILNRQFRTSNAIELYKWRSFTPAFASKTSV